MHRNRALKLWTGRDGATCGTFRFTARCRGGVPGGHRGAEGEARQRGPDGGAAGAVRRDCRRRAGELVTEERWERSDQAAEDDGDRPRRLRGALPGALADGEVCEIAGIGPVPLEVARRLAADSILRVLVTKGGAADGGDAGRADRPPGAALLARDPRQGRVPFRVATCREACRSTTADDFALLGPTDLENCALLCRVHHDMKTYLGYRLERHADGSWTFTPPDDYRIPSQPIRPLASPSIATHGRGGQWSSVNPRASTSRG